MDNKSIRIQEIAKLAGVSKATVSRVLNGKPDVSPETRKKVEDVIERYNYYPSARAQAFSYQRNMAVGLVFTHDEASTLSNPYYAELIQGIMKKARETNYHITLTYFLNDDCFLLVHQKAVDGLLILTPDSTHKEKLQQLMDMGIPIVSTARVMGLDKLHYVAVDEYGAAMKIFDHLFDMGHVNIGFISGPRHLYSAHARLRAYKDALKKHGVPFDQTIVAYGDTSVESGQRIMKDLLYKGKKMTAIFTGSDLMAIGARHAIEEMGMRVPEDISLVSTDATDIIRCLDVPVTTTKQPTRLRGELAMGMLVDQIEGRDTPASIMLPMDIDIHQSAKTVGKKT